MFIYTYIIQNTRSKVNILDSFHGTASKSHLNFNIKKKKKKKKKNSTVIIMKNYLEMEDHKQTKRV